MNAYVNVDVCFTGMPNCTHFISVNRQSSDRYILSIQILFKGPDIAQYLIRDEKEPSDEAVDYVSARWLGASEASYRILQFKFSSWYPTIICLHTHLEG